MDESFDPRLLRIRTPPPDESLSPRKSRKKTITRSTINMIGLLIGAFIVGYTISQIPHSVSPSLLIWAVICVIALIPLCVKTEVDELPI